MATGDLVQYKEKHWKVLSENRDVRTITLQNWDGDQLEVADNDPDLGKLSPPGQWPFITAPSVSPKAKRPRRLVRMVRGNPVDLVPFCEWSPTGLLRLGGPIFLSPSLRLMPGEVLVLHYENGVASRLAITRSFLSVEQRRRRATKKIQKPKTSWDILDEDDD